MLLTTVPRYLPKSFVPRSAQRSRLSVYPSSAMVESLSATATSFGCLLCPPCSHRHLLRERDGRVAGQREGLLVLAPLDRMGDALDEVEAVVARACAAHADELPRFEDVVVPQDVQRPRSADHIGRLRRLRKPDRGRLERCVLRHAA